MNKYTEMATINRTIERAREEGLGIPETALRRWVKEGAVPATYVGKKALINWTTLMNFIGRVA